MKPSQHLETIHCKRKKLKFFNQLPINEAELSFLLLLNKIPYKAASLRYIEGEIKKQQNVHNIAFTLVKKKMISKIESKIDRKGFYFLLTLHGENFIKKLF